MSAQYVSLSIHIDWRLYIYTLFLCVSQLHFKLSNSNQVEWLYNSFSCILFNNYFILFLDNNIILLYPFIRMLPLHKIYVEKLSSNNSLITGYWALSAV